MVSRAKTAQRKSLVSASKPIIPRKFLEVIRYPVDRVITVDISVDAFFGGANVTPEL